MRPQGVGPDTLRHLQARAAAVLPPAAYDYYAAGSGDEVTVGEAAAAWRRWRFRPRVLRDVSAVSTAVEVPGAALTHPVLVAPTALHVLADPQGELATARGAAAAGSLLVLSARSSRPVDEVAAVAGPWWSQVYVLRDRGLTDAQVTAAAAAGARALVLTVDTPYVATKARVTGPLPIADERVRRVAVGTRDPACEQDPAVGWDVIGRLAAVSGLPVLVKGVLHPADADECVRAGAAGVIVSNHGGRQLDRAAATADALAPVVRAVAGRVPVLVDGGIRTGADVLTALALGARAVLVGRPVLWALATGGAAGVHRCLDAYRGQLAEAMALAGVRRLADVDADLIVPAHPPA